MLQMFEIIWTLFTKILLNITMYDSFSPFSFSFCIQVQTVKTQMKCSIRWHFIRICTANCKDWKTSFSPYNTYSELKGLTYRLLDRYSLHVISILFRKNVDHDQTASSETSCSGSTVLSKRMQYCLSQIYFKGKISLRVWLLKWKLLADLEWWKKNNLIVLTRLVL